MERYCGTCKYWQERSTRDGHSRCHVPIDEMKIPNSLYYQVIALERTLCKATDGTDCPCFERKEA